MHPDDEAALLACETALLDPAVRRVPERVEALLAEDFCEIGASGRFYGRADILAHLARETPSRQVIQEFSARLIAPDLALTLYRIVRGGSAHSLRSSVWRRDGGEWRMVFHQGTPAEPGVGVRPS